MNAKPQVELTEDMQMFDYWSQVYSPADRHIDSLRAAYDAFLQHYTLPRTEQMIVEDIDFQLSAHTTNMRVFTPNQATPSVGWSWIFYVHGGGNVVGSADSHEYIARQLARDLNVKVFLLEYGLLPEFSWTQGTQDCIEAYQQILANAEAWNIMGTQSAIVADASGCSIALHMQQHLAQQGIQLGRLALLFPTLYRAETTTEVSSLVYQVENQALVQSWLACPLNVNDQRTLAQLNNLLPETFVAVADGDDQQVNAELLNMVGQNAKAIEVKTAHGLRGSCLPLMRDCPETATVYEAVVQFLNQYFKN